MPNVASGGFFSSATVTMVSIWLLTWGIRRQGELDDELDNTAKHALDLAIGTIVTAPRFESKWFVALGWIWATAFLAWPNFAYHLTKLLRWLKILPAPVAEGSGRP